MPVILLILDVNDNEPEFEKDVYEVTISEVRIILLFSNFSHSTKPMLAKLFRKVENCSEMKFFGHLLEK